jgi:hypothetical protein
MCTNWDRLRYAGVANGARDKVNDSRRVIPEDAPAVYQASAKVRKHHSVRER